MAAGAISDFLQSERASRPTSRKEKRQRQKDKKKSLFKKAIEKEKPVFDPNLKTFDEYIEEYYKLNFEDVIGKTPVRFEGALSGVFGEREDRQIRFASEER